MLPLLSLSNSRKAKRALSISCSVKRISDDILSTSSTLGTLVTGQQRQCRFAFGENTPGVELGCFAPHVGYKVSANKIVARWPFFIFKIFQDLGFGWLHVLANKIVVSLPAGRFFVFKKIQIESASWLEEIS